MKKVLVTGGCGYIGSHTIIDLINSGFEVISVDNNSNSDLMSLDGIHKITGQRVKNYTVDLCDYEKAAKIFRNESFDGVIHFAALKSVGESVFEPLRYYDNNITSLLNVLKCCKEFAVENFIFSSSCSVYGNAKDLPVTEDTAFEEAECPYARTKQMGEHMIKDFSFANKNIKSINLRYFNPAGAHESAIIGEASLNAPTNLVPVITETAIGKRDSLTVFGSDYDTRDGSCIRDYIHVMDLASAHTKSIQYLIANKNESNCEVFNLGIGQGVTVLEAIHAFEKVSGKKLNYTIGDRRPGDVVSIYASMDKAKAKLQWETQYNIEDIMRTAWNWEVRRTEAVLQS